jgi:hypothetical protein
MRSTISHTKNHLSALLERVQAGETLVILDRDRPIARVERITCPEHLAHLTPPRVSDDPLSIFNLPLGGIPDVPTGCVQSLLEERAESR